MILQRIEESEQGTFGVLRLPGFTCFTLELPWRNNQSNVSRIPAGHYKAVVTYSPRFKQRLYLLAPTEPRVGIRIHPANLASQLNGCIALGEKLGWIDGRKAVLLSQPAVRRLHQLTGERPFDLEIKDAVV